MRKCVLLAFILMYLGSLAADLAWPQPLEVCSFDNIEFQGVSLLTHDNCHLLSWQETTGVVPQVYFRLYDQFYQPMWPNPLAVNIPFGISGCVETSDAGFVIHYLSGGGRAIKISRNGDFLWGAEGTFVYPVTESYGTDLVADNSGGVYISWINTRGFYGLAMFQHLDANGNFTMQEEGLPLNTGCDAYSTRMLIQPDNSVIIAWNSDYVLRFNRFSTTGQQYWTQHNSISSTSRSLRPWFCAFSDQSFSLSICHNDTLDMCRYNPSGAALWANPVTCIVQGNINWFSVKVKRASDNSMLIMADAYDGTYLQKVSSEGVLQYPQTIHLDESVGSLYDTSDIIPLDQGACAVIVSSSLANAGPGDIKVLRIESSGIVSVYPVTNTSSAYVCPAGHRVGNEIHIEWQHWGSTECGMYVQILNSNMQPILMDNGLALRIGSSGIVDDLQSAAIATGCAVIWSKSQLQNSRSQLYLQMYNINGQPFFDPHGIMVSRSGSRLRGYSKIISNGSNVMIIWADELDGISSTRMQIVDGAGNFLMVNGGIEINPGSEGAGKYNMSSYDGDWYLIYSGGEVVMGQKIRGTQFLWGNGLQLSSVHPERPGTVTSCSLIFPWLFWHSGCTDLCKRIDTNGATMPGFMDYGKTIPVPSILSDFPSYGYNRTVCGDYLHYLWAVDDPSYPEDYPHTAHYQSFYGPQVDLLLAPRAIEIDGSWNAYWKNDALWIVTGGEFFRIRKFDLQLNLLLDESVPNPGSYSIYPSFWDLILSNSEHLLVIATYNYIYHMFIDENWDANVPADYILSNHQGSSPPSVVMNGDRVWVSWYSGRSDSYDMTSIALQRIFRASLPVQDEQVPGLTVPNIKACWPNPFHPSTSIAFSLPQKGKASLVVYDLKGRKVRELVNEVMEGAEHTVIWDGKTTEGNSAASGVYFLKLTSKEGSHTRKITLVK